MNNNISHSGYSKVLQRWIPAARSHLCLLAGGDVCFGPGNHENWAVQAHTTAFAAFAVLAADPEMNPAVSGMGRDEMRDTAVGMLHYTLRSHRSGGGVCASGKPWGHSWISALCIERMMHGVEAIEPHLTDEDRQGLRRMLLSESDWLMDHYEIKAGLVENNKPESNMWNGALLCRTAMMYPDAPRAADYREKGIRFLVNAISVPADAQSTAILDGRPVKERHVGANFFDSYACNHHRYLNVGYMVITLSNVAMLHFTFRRLGVKPPEALYHHVPELWRLVNTCTFPDGRLLRIGGDTRVRYCYCQDYLIPVWVMMRDKYAETDIEDMEKAWLRQVVTEMAASTDASFLGERLGPMKSASPVYYARLEGDRAASLSMGAYWRRLYAEFQEAAPSARQTELLSQWHDDYHGAFLTRSPQRIASWVWRAAEPPQGLCLPPDLSNMAEWRTNLAGRISGVGLVTNARIEAHTGTVYDGGFATCGRIIHQTDQMMAEGDIADDIAVMDIAFAAVPDGRTVIGMQRAFATHRSPIRELKGLMLQIPNDLFNGGQRRYIAKNSNRTVESRTGHPETSMMGKWLNVDDRLGVLSLNDDMPLILHRPGHRQITIRAGSWQARASYGDGLLCADEICLGICSEDLKWAQKDETLFDVAFAIRSNVSAAETEEWANPSTIANRTFSLSSSDLRGAVVAGADGNFYAIVANFSGNPAGFGIPVLEALKSGGKGDAAPSGERPLYSLAAHSCALLRWCADSGRWLELEASKKQPVNGLK